MYNTAQSSTENISNAHNTATPNVTVARSRDSNFGATTLFHEVLVFRHLNVTYDGLKSPIDRLLDRKKYTYTRGTEDNHPNHHCVELVQNKTGTRYESQSAVTTRRKKTLHNQEL